MNGSRPDIERLFVGSEPEDLALGYLYVPDDQPRLVGTAVRALGLSIGERSSGLLVPAARTTVTPIDFVGTYIAAKDYFIDLDRASAESAVLRFVEASPFRNVVTDLVIVNHVAGDMSLSAEVEAHYLGILRPEAKVRLQAALDGDDPRRVLLARQLVIRAIRYAIEVATVDDAQDEFGFGRAIAVSHIVADAIVNDAQSEAEDEERIGGIPRQLAMEMIRNELFNQSEEHLRLPSRTLLLWRLEPNPATHPLRVSPSDLLKEATGLSPVAWLAFGFGVLAHRSSNPPGGPVWMPTSFFSESVPQLRASFLGQISSTRESLAADFADADPQWGFVPIEQTPVLRDGDEYLLIDAQFLIERVTSGLYWFVFDHERMIGSEQRKAWTRAFGNIFEQYAVSIVNRISPPLLNGSTTFYGEDLIGEFTGAKACDCAADFGRDMVLVEIVGGRLTLESRIDGDLSALSEKLEQLVIEKAQQLDEVSRKLMESEDGLTGHSAPSRRRYFPVVVNVGGFPMNPVTTSMIEERLRDEELLTDPRVADLAVIDIGELETIEALSETLGMSFPDILQDWKEGTLANVALRNHLYSEIHSIDPNTFRSQEILGAWGEIEDLLVNELLPELPDSTDSTTDGHHPDA